MDGPLLKSREAQILKCFDRKPKKRIFHILKRFIEVLDYSLIPREFYCAFYNLYLYHKLLTNI